MKAWRTALRLASLIVIVVCVAFLSNLALASSWTLNGIGRVSPLGTTSSVESEVGAPGSSTATITRCAVGSFPEYGAVDASNGYIYIANSGNNGGGSISIIKPPCTKVGAIIPPTPPESPATPWGVVYDPFTSEVVVSDAVNGVAWVVQGLTIVKTIQLGGFGEQLGLGAWDPQAEAVLIPDAAVGVDVIDLTLAHGVTQVHVQLGAFDTNLNGPTNLLVADGYVFSGGQNIDIFDAKTFHPEGSFPVPQGSASLTSMAWDPLSGEAILGELSTSTSHAAVFLNANSIATHKFTFHFLNARNILDGGAAGVAYSSADQSVLLAAFHGSDVWILSSSGELSHVYMPNTPGGLGELFTDSANGAVYLVGYNSGLLYELGR